MTPEKPFGLIIEDDPDLSNIFSEAVHAAGFETEFVFKMGRACPRAFTWRDAQPGHFGFALA